MYNKHVERPPPAGAGEVRAPPLPSPALHMAYRPRFTLHKSPIYLDTAITSQYFPGGKSSPFALHQQHITFSLSIILIVSTTLILIPPPQEPHPLSQICPSTREGWTFCLNITPPASPRFSLLLTPPTQADRKYPIQESPIMARSSRLKISSTVPSWGFLLYNQTFWQRDRDRDKSGFVYILVLSIQCSKFKQMTDNNRFTYISRTNSHYCQLCLLYKNLYSDDSPIKGRRKSAATKTKETSPASI